MSDDRDHLPLPDYDHLPLEVLRQRIRTLDATQLESVLDYEQQHGDRLPVTEVLRVRLDDLRAGAEPSAGDPQAAPGTGDGPPSPHTLEPTQEDPALNPPRHGVPGNPQQ